MDSKENKSKIIHKKKSLNLSIYSRCLITRTIIIPIQFIGKNIKETLDKKLADELEGKCIVEGFVKKGSVKVITYSSGLIKGVNISFQVVFECYSCYPVEGMLIDCIAKNITKAGIRAESSKEDPSPIVVFITRDHSYMQPYFATINEGDTFVVRIIGQRFELNDKYVSVIAELIEPKERFKKDIYNNKEKSNTKARIIIDDL